MVDLDSNPTKLLDVVAIGRQMLITRGALTTFSIANDLAKYFAIIPALFALAYPQLDGIDVLSLRSPQSAILSAVIFNALIMVLLVPLALRGVRYVPASAAALLRRNVLLYGCGGVIAPACAPAHATSNPAPIPAHATQRDHIPPFAGTPHSTRTPMDDRPLKSQPALSSTRHPTAKRKFHSACANTNARTHDRRAAMLVVRLRRRWSPPHPDPPAACRPARPPGCGCGRRACAGWRSCGP